MGGLAGGPCRRAAAPAAENGSLGASLMLNQRDVLTGYFRQLADAHAALSWPTFEAIVDRLFQACQCGATVYTFGNGGSAALASHWACDFAKNTVDLTQPHRRCRVVSLADNVPLMTAWANDNGYEWIFAEQLQGLVASGDVALAISGSGNSPNVLRALQVARRAGACTIGLSGSSGGKMRELCDMILMVASESMQIIEDVHLSACHAMFLALRHRLQAPVALSAAAGAR